jgi:hypothetical protein
LTETISLGGRQFELQPLKLGQLRRLVDALDRMSRQRGGGLIEAAAEVVAAGLAPAHPELTADALLDLEAGVDELNAAVGTVLRAAGLRPLEQGTAAGEALPTEPTPREGSFAGSTPPSPPAATGVTATSTN